MDYLIEGVIVTIDCVAFGYFFNSFLKAKNCLLRLENVPQLNVDKGLVTAVKEKGGTLPYVCLRGNVTALSPPLNSFNAPAVTGVIQKVTIREHVVSQTRSGFWIDRKRVVNEILNHIPFAVKSKDGDVSVEVVDALAAKVLDLEVVADKFDPASSGFLGTLLQFVTGVRKQGVQTVEEFLKEGTMVTVVGEVVDGPSSLAVMPASDGAPFFITTLPLRALMRRVESDIKFHKWLTLLFGTVTTVTFIWLIYKRHRKESNRKTEQLTRRNRRKRERNCDELPMEQICVVCQANPKEIILLPCGHVCLCEDCSDKIPDTCPLCNQKIQARNEAYIA